MIRCLDDIIVSAYLNEAGYPFRVLKLAVAGPINLYASEPIFDEYKNCSSARSVPWTPGGQPGVALKRPRPSI
jgi:hypothetical protein